MSCTDNIGRNLKRIRKDNGISQEHLANEAFMSTAHLRALEHCKGNPTIKTLEKIAECLDTDIDTLIREPKQ